MFEKEYLENLYEKIEREEYLTFLMIRAMNNNDANKMYSQEFLDIITNLELKIRERIYPASKIGASYRVINHWTEKGILADLREENSREWRKFSFSDLVWVKILEELRGYGMSLDKIKAVYDRVIQGVHGHYNIFEKYLVLCLIKSPLYLSISANGDVETPLALSPINNGQNSNIQIYVHRIVDELINRTQNYTEIETPKEGIAPSHRKVLELLKSDNWKEMTLLKKGHDIKDCIISGDIDVSQPLHKILDQLEYGELSLKRESGKIVAGEHKIRKKIKS